MAAAALVCFALAVPFSAIPHQMETRDTRMGRMVQADIDSGRIDSRLRDFLWLNGAGAVYGALAALLYARLRNARRMALALDEAELDRAQAQSDLVASQVQAVRARIDPTFVFARLATIEQAYERDPAAADALLDELIAFLREAIPRLRNEGSLKEPAA
jgi:sensor histidine kinase YesM